MPNALVPCTAACASLHHLHFQTASTGLRPLGRRHDTISHPSQNTDAGGNLYGLQRPAVNRPFGQKFRVFLQLGKGEKLRTIITVAAHIPYC